MPRDSKQTMVYQLIRERIEQNIYPAGHCLPKEIDFARELGISRTTLRPVLEQLELENRIERIKGKGTFVRNPDSAKTKILVLCDTENNISSPFHYIFPGMQIAAEEAHVKLELCALFPLMKLLGDECAVRIAQAGFQGIIWCTNNFSGRERHLELIRKTGLPVLLPHALKTDAFRTGFYVLGCDFRKVIEDGLMYFANQGHRRVAHITSEEMRGVTVQEYFEAVRKARLDETPELLQTAECENIGTAMDALMNAPGGPPDALLCFSDFYTVKVYEYCAAHHIRIPEDLAVLSIGGHIGCSFMNPTLSTIDFDNQEIGRQALRCLLEILRNQRTFPPYQVTPHRIIERESTRNQRFRTDRQIK
ncbi:MAG: LacI family transcriptional regulator [Lentisphaeria bacterium]|nr:LacI family transcriptional regulator [Lentisphaeria bacterium]